MKRTDNEAMKFETSASFSCHLSIKGSNQKLSNEIIYAKKLKMRSNDGKRAKKDFNSHEKGIGRQIVTDRVIRRQTNRDMNHGSTIIARGIAQTLLCHTLCKTQQNSNTTAL